MADKINVEVSGFAFVGSSYREIFKNLQQQPEYKRWLEGLGKKAEKELKASIKANSGSVKGANQKGQDEAKEYFSKNVHGYVKRGRFKNYAVVGSYGNNAADYEAEHGNIVKAKNKMRSEGAS